MKVFIFNKQTDLNIIPDQIAHLAAEVVRYEKKTCDEVNIHFVETKKICSLHKKYFKESSPPTASHFLWIMMERKAIQF